MRVPEVIRFAVTKVAKLQTAVAKLLHVNEDAVRLVERDTGKDVDANVTVHAMIAKDDPELRVDLRVA